jgi:putative DNA methylase
MKTDQEVYVEPVLEGNVYRFTVKVGKPANAEQVKNGTKLARGANFRCILSDSPIEPKYIQAEGNAGRMGARLMAIVAEGKLGRVYLAPTLEHEAAARKASPNWLPEGETPSQLTGGGAQANRYGLKTWASIFTPRQLEALTTFSDLVQEARERVRQDALAADMTDDGLEIDAGGTGVTAYADAVGVYLAFGVDKMSDRHSTLCRWDPTPTASGIINTFSRQALPMTWDYPEGNPLSEASGNFEGGVGWIAKVIDLSLPPLADGAASQADASIQTLSKHKLISTDPPYYDNIAYADLSDFFYVWLRRTLKPIFPGLFATLTVPNA